MRGNPQAIEVAGRATGALRRPSRGVRRKWACSSPHGPRSSDAPEPNWCSWVTARPGPLSERRREGSAPSGCRSSVTVTCLPISTRRWISASPPAHSRRSASRRSSRSPRAHRCSAPTSVGSRRTSDCRGRAGCSPRATGVARRRSHRAAAERSHRNRREGSQLRRSPPRVGDGVRRALRDLSRNRRSVTLLVSIHDVTPAFAPAVGQLWTMCARHSVCPALLVVPNWHGDWPLARHPAFVGLAAGTRAQGADIVLHGERHDETGLPRGPGDALRAWGRTAREGEFLTLDEPAARERIDRGVALLNRLGLPPVGFVPPAWLVAGRLSSCGRGGGPPLQRRRILDPPAPRRQTAPVAGRSMERSLVIAGPRIRRRRAGTLAAPGSRALSASGASSSGSLQSHHRPLARADARALARPAPGGRVRRGVVGRHRMTLLQAHLVCVALVAADNVARAWRIQWIVQGLGHRISFRDSFILNAFGDAACALTPLRIGGEPARLAGMLRSRVPATAAFVAISLEVLAAWPVIIVAAGWLVWEYAPAWWRWRVHGSRRRRSGLALGGRCGRGERGRMAVRAPGHLSRQAPAPSGPARPGLLAPDATLATGRQHSVSSGQSGYPRRHSAGARAHASGATGAGPSHGGIVCAAVQSAGAPDTIGSRCGGAGIPGRCGGRSRGKSGRLLFAWRLYTNGIGVVLGVWLAAKI